jgi:hypothetical protein
MPLLSHLTMFSPHNVIKRKSLSKIIFFNFPLDTLTCLQWGAMPWPFLSLWRTSLGVLPTTNHPWTIHIMTLALGSWPRQGAWKGAGRECNPRVTFTLLGVRENVMEWTHTPKWTPTLGVGIPMDSWIFTEQFDASKFIGLKIPYTIEKLFRRRCLKWDHIIHLSTKNISYGQ